jgi:rubrerythrin
VAAMAIAYEQTEVELTANLAQNEPDKYFHQVLDFALLEDFDHLFRYGCLLSLVENKDPNDITQGKTEFKPGRPTIAEHRHPFDEMRKCYDKDKATLKTKMNYHTIVSAEQETMLFYKSHGFMYADNLARGLFTEIADVEQQHVTQYELVGDPRETPLEKMAILQLCEAYNYYCCAITETDPCLAKLWDRFCEMEITHFNLCAKLMADFEKRDIRDVMGADTIESLIAFEPNKHYINRVLHDQTNLQPLDLAFVDTKKLPEDWASFGFRETVNNGGVPSEDVVQRAMDEGKLRAA